MRRIRRAVKWFTDRLPYIITFVTGFIIPVIAKSASEFATPWSPIFLSLLSALVLFSVITIIQTKLEISREVDRSRITVSFYPRSPESEGDAEIFDPIINRIRMARKQVKILGSSRRSGSRSSKSRERYFKEIEKIVTKKIQADGEFTYERIVQIDRSIATDEQPHKASLRLSEIDRLTFDHCKRAASLTERSGQVQAFFRRIPAVMPDVTLILIDRDYVILSLPWFERDESKDLDSQQLGKCFVFHDYSGRLAGEMTTMLKVITFHAPAIHNFIEDL